MDGAATTTSTIGYTVPATPGVDPVEETRLGRSRLASLYTRCRRTTVGGEALSAKKRVPPSRVRYEAANPVISMRVSRVLYLQLRDIKQITGKSVADILREAMGTQYDKGTEAWGLGYSRGYKKAQEKYRVNFRCNTCGGTVALFGQKAMLAAAELMREAGWGHPQCVRR